MAEVSEEKLDALVRRVELEFRSHEAPRSHRCPFRAAADRELGDPYSVEIRDEVARRLKARVQSNVQSSEIIRRLGNITWK